MATRGEIAVEVDGLRLAGLVWGPEDGTPVLALHGWMDHVGSFAELAPRLAGCRVVALDLSGQGLSDRRAAHATYNIWDDLPQIAGVLDRLGWGDAVVMGHSRGAIIGALLAAVQPGRVRGLVALDSLVPEPTEASVVETLAAFVDETRAQMARPPRVFASREAFVERRERIGIARHISEALAERALDEGPEGVALRGDPRLFASSAMKLRRDDVESVMRAISCPVLNVWGSDGIRARRPGSAELARVAPGLVGDYRAVEVAGDHHFHMDARAAEETAAEIAAFIEAKSLRGPAKAFPDVR